MWLSLITLVLKVISNVSGYLETKQYLDAGQAKALAEGLQLTLTNLEKANAAKKEVADNPHGDFARKLRDKYQDDEHK